MSRAHLLNEDMPIVDRGSLALVLRSILPDETLSAVRESIERVLAPKIGPQLSIGAVVVESKIHLLGQIDQSGKWAPEVFRALESVTMFERDADRNRHVYNHAIVDRGKTFWPNPAHPHDGRKLTDIEPVGRNPRIIGRSTPIGSAGSCFAMEIAHRLQNGGFNYVITEKFKIGQDKDNGVYDACAAWGTIFNIPALRQLVEKAYGINPPPMLLYRDEFEGRTIYCDPFREGVWFDSVEGYEATYQSHLAACRRALDSCKVFVMTLGLNEVWYLRATNHVLSRCPWKLAPGLIRRALPSVEENLADLELMLSTWRRFNPEMKLIVTVSPVPLHATFRHENTHVVEANCHSKAMMRVVAEEFVRRHYDDNVFYFPAYETVMYCSENAWRPDGRHVSRHTVDKVMSVFSRMYLEDGQNIASSKQVECKGEAAPQEGTFS